MYRKSGSIILLTIVLLALCSLSTTALAANHAHADATIANHWTDSSRNFAQINLTISNMSDAPVSNWMVLVRLSGESALTQYWSGEFAIDGALLTIAPVEYNRIIPAQGIVTLGCIVNSSAAISLGECELTVDGEPIHPNVEETIEFTTYAEGEMPDPTAEPITTPTPATAAPSPQPTHAPGTATPYQQHGKLSISGTRVIDAQGAPFTIRGVSTHGIAWFPQYVNEAAFRQLRDDWNVNTIRLAMYSDPNAGYSRALWSLVKSGVNIAHELGMYAIIDWHILSDGNPNKYADEAGRFFQFISTECAEFGNVIYEICNEPNGNVSWLGDIKPYAERIIPVIRANDPDGIMIVGTPTWSQDVDVAARSPISGQRNIAYALHFYAATHTQPLRSKLSAALAAGLPVIVSEFGTCDSSGNGANNFEQSCIWLDMLEQNGVGYVCWNLSNKGETSALIASSCAHASGWSESELSESGAWYRRYVRDN